MFLGNRQGRRRSIEALAHLNQIGPFLTLCTGRQRLDCRLQHLRPSNDVIESGPLLVQSTLLLRTVGFKLPNVGIQFLLSLLKRLQPCHVLHAHSVLLGAQGLSRDNAPLVLHVELGGATTLFNESLRDSLQLGHSFIP